MKNFETIKCVIALVALGLAGCGGAGSDVDPVQPPAKRAVPAPPPAEGDIGPRFQVVPAWQYAEGCLSVVLAYSSWPSNVEGFKITATELSSGTEYKLHTAPLVPVIRRGRDLSGFVYEKPELQKQAEAEFERWYESEGGKETNFTPAELAQKNYLIKNGMWAMLDFSPLALFGLGVRCARDVPPEKYKIEVKALGDPRIFGEREIDTSVGVPFPPLVEFTCYTTPTKAVLSYHWEREPFSEKIAFFNVVGRHKSGGEDFREDACIASSKSNSSMISGTELKINPTEYEFGMDACDWFGNRLHYDQKEKLSYPIRITDISTSTNQVVEIGWKLPDTVPDHFEVEIQKNFRRAFHNAKRVGQIPAKALRYDEQTDYDKQTSVHYRLLLKDGTTVVSTSSSHTYQHGGTFVPLPGRIAKIETNTVDGVKGILIYPQPSPYIKDSAYTVTIQTKNGPKKVFPKFQNVREIPIRLEGIARPGESYTIQVCEAALLPGNTGDLTPVRRGLDSEPVRLVEPTP